MGDGEVFGRGRFSSGGCSGSDCTFIERDGTGMDRRFGCWEQSLVWGCKYVDGLEPASGIVAWNIGGSGEARELVECRPSVRVGSHLRSFGRICNMKSEMVDCMTSA